MNSPSIDIQPVTTRRQQRLFMQFAWDHYRDDPNWIPPLRDNFQRLVGFKPHPFYDRNQVRAFLAWKDGQVAGRIVAISGL